MSRIWSRLTAAILGRLDAALGLPRAAREAGGLTVEFVILLPAFLMVFISSFEASIFLTRQIMIERAVDIAVREIRLDSNSTVTQGQLRRKICQHVRVVSNCELDLLVELTEISPTNYAVPTSDTPCVNRLTSVVPPPDYVENRAGRMIMLRACYSAEPQLPFTTMTTNTLYRTNTLGSYLVADNEDGSIRTVTSTIFVVESN
ncbi:TadE/TadG family type IV pilus assembly protein [Jannaschia pohangensis]|uniref:TadE-like protein n=1 Tax=Jannaschia pohangensis TaxID=390807 RepID=A0A1I3LPC5_9RHOB|nr:TadE family protein [Jannaschia pohangensis]SFI86567.1 TadE-like protein [Jannaschia pohangensis]